MTQIIVQPIDVEEIELTNDVAALTKSSYSLIISSQKEYIKASDLLKQIKVGTKNSIHKEKRLQNRLMKQKTKS